ncbi:hypothetical protein J6590_078660 [Homalodisca vitripennis]|nr:hypothetical protein J6590_078660 [Homalodisca vitripennis]
MSSGVVGSVRYTLSFMAPHRKNPKEEVRRSKRPRYRPNSTYSSLLKSLTLRINIGQLERNAEERHHAGESFSDKISILRTVDVPIKKWGPINLQPRMPHHTLSDRRL